MENKFKVLVVDDEIEIQKSISRYFSFFNDIETICASSFEEASKRLESEHPRISIIDISLPDGNGLDLIKLARKISAVNQVIIISGVSDLVRVIDALELGAIDFLTKPLEMEDLRMVVSEAVNRCKRWQGLFKNELGKW